jgi:maleylpyruvate isomerase
MAEVMAEVMDGVRDSHRRLLDDLDALTDEEARAASLLPGWSVGHVLTHLARNADSHVRALEGAMRDEVVERYPGGPDQRAAEIEAGSGRSAAELVDDVRTTANRLEATWLQLDEAAWTREGSSGGREPIASLPFMRWREVEVHRVDLGLGATPDDWPSGYVRRELRLAAMAWRARMPMGQTELPTAALAMPPVRRLAWFLGREQVDGLPAVRPWW